MAASRNITEVIAVLGTNQAQRAMSELSARRDALGTWDKVAYSLGDKFNPAYLWQVGAGRKKPSRRLLRALGIVKPEKRTDVRIRMTLADARKVEQGIVPVNVANRVRYALWGKS